jgi:phosphatase NudJ
VTFLRFAFRGTLGEAEPGRGLDPEIIALHWLTRDELAARAALHRSPLVLRCVDDYLAGRGFPLELLSRDFA